MEVDLSCTGVAIVCGVACRRDSSNFCSCLGQRSSFCCWEERGSTDVTTSWSSEVPDEFDVSAEDGAVQTESGHNRTRKGSWALQ